MKTTSTIEFKHPEGKYYEINGKRLWVEQHGDGEPVVLLSGLGPAGSHVVFHPHFDSLAQHYHVIYVDLYGRGRSDRPNDLSTITFASDVADIVVLLMQFNLGPVHLYGFSYGGLIAQALALDHAHLVKSLVLANSLHSPEMWQKNHENINREIAHQDPKTWAEIEKLHVQGVPSTAPPMAALFFSAVGYLRFFNPSNASRIATEENARNTELYPLFCGEDVDFKIGGEIIKIPDFRMRLKDISIPMLILAGKFDRALYPKLQIQFIEYAPQAIFHLLEKSGSFSHIEETERLFEILREFFSGKKIEKLTQNHL